MTTRRKVLLVEGKDDRHVVSHLLIKHGLEGACSVVEKEGFTRLRDSIAAEVNVSRVQTIGIVADANASVEKRWQSLRDAAEAANCRPPAELPP